ncbi:MHYT domain-containing protein [Sphingomonas sp. ID0503]|uniref:MHYT domain-containing protein n=1 Tax=Sphingomonas sp. ID0503 TaxID=3399691 RepID=UPI003AFAA5E9
MALSILVAVAASYTALDLGGRVIVTRGSARRLWLGTAAVAMGGGIWAMHFVAMLAFKMPGMTFGYDIGLTLASLAIAIVATGFGFWMMTATSGFWALLPAGLFMGLGVLSMHYMGMAAMRMNAALSYDRGWVAISVAIAIAAATAALWLTTRNNRVFERAGAAAVMGFAIAGMHYAGMRAAIFTMDPGAPMGRYGLDQGTLASAVAATAFLIFFLALVAAMFDRRFAHLAEREAVALRHSEERFRSLYSRSPLPLHSLDAQGRLEQVSNAWSDLTGYAPAEVLGRTIADFLAPESAARFEDDLRELLSSGSVADREYRLVTRGGEERIVVASARVEHDGEGKFLHILGGFSDVTERHLAEDALRQAQKMEAIGHLTGGVAHDFNNLLAVVIGSLDLLRRRLPEEPAVQRLLDNAMNGAQRGAMLTQRLLAFARRQDLRPAAVDLARLVAGMTDLLRSSIGPQIAIETSFPAALPMAKVDAHQLELAILNLAVNARDAMPGGGRLTISADEESVRGDTDGLVAGNYLRLKVADTGEGMDAATLARAEEPFFTTKGVGKGTGLGLPMVHGLAAQSGGRLQLNSVKREGTTATLWLPVAPDHLASVPEGAAEAHLLAPAGTRSILLVDDDPMVLDSTAAVIEALGHRVVTAGSGEAAMIAVEGDTEIDLVLTDHLMPGMTGAEVASRIAARRPDLTVLLMTGFADLDGDRISRPVLRKPFTQEALDAAIRRAG